MPSPFPGMDPYLETGARWRDLHLSLIAALRTQLNQVLPRAFAARMNARCLSAEREPFLEIVAVGNPGEVVATIELLSPANKRSRAGHEEYQRKQGQLLDSGIHLLEIDLLRSGSHTVAVPEDALRLESARWDYLACLHRAGAGPHFDVWPFTLRDPLPTLPVPLSDGHDDALLDLQAAFDRVYDEGRLAAYIDYRVEPDPPLALDDDVWADALLRVRGLR